MQANTNLDSVSSNKTNKSLITRKIPYSNNDFLSDSSGSENDIDIIEPLSLKDRLLGKSSSCGMTSSCKELIKPDNKCGIKASTFHIDSDDCMEIESENCLITTSKCFTASNDNRPQQDKASFIDRETVSYDYKNSLASKSGYSISSLASSSGHSQGSMSSVSRSYSKTEKSEKAIKRKRTPEEIEEKRKEAQLKKELSEKRKQDRETLQLEKKKNMQIRKLEGERKKQMGAWGQSLEFMKIVMDPHIINDCGLGAAIFKAAEELKVPCVTEELGLPFTISWKRTVTDWVETGFEVESIKKEIIEDEAVIVLPVSDFILMVENSKKDCLEGQTTLLQCIQMVQRRQPGIKFTPVVIGLEKYFRELKNAQSRQHREAVLGQSPETSKKRKNKSNAVVSRIDVEDACSVVQLQTDCVVQILDAVEDITDLMKTYTKAVAEKPAKKDRLNSVFSFHQDGSTGVKVDRSGNGLLKVWKQQLLQFKSVSPDIAEAIIAEYPSPQLLMKAYSKCSSQEEGIKLLDDIVVRRGAGVLETTRRIGKEMSRRFYLFFTSTDPNCVIK